MRGHRGLSMEDEVDLIQRFGPDFDLDLGEVSLDNLHGKLEQTAVMVIYYVAKQDVVERLEEVQELMDDHDLEFDTISDEDRLAYFAPRSEREPADNCTVFEYRGVEDPGQALDVWEVRLGDSWKIYFEAEPAGGLPIKTSSQRICSEIM